MSARMNFDGGRRGADEDVPITFLSSGSNVERGQTIVSERLRNTLGLPPQGTSRPAMQDQGQQIEPSTAQTDFRRAATFVEPAIPTSEAILALPADNTSKPGDTLVPCETPPQVEPQTAPSTQLLEAMDIIKKYKAKAADVGNKIVAVPKADAAPPTATLPKATELKKRPSAAVAKMTPVKEPEKKRRCKPRVDFELSRNQILGRTCFAGPNESVKFRFGVGNEYKNLDAAKAAANKWLREEQAKQGVVVDA